YYSGPADSLAGDPRHVSSTLGQATARGTHQRLHDNPRRSRQGTSGGTQTNRTTRRGLSRSRGLAAATGTSGEYWESIWQLSVAPRFIPVGISCRRDLFHSQWHFDRFRG